MSKDDCERHQERLRLIEAAEKLVDRAMQSPLEVRQFFSDTLAAAQGYLERQFNRDKT